MSFQTKLPVEPFLALLIGTAVGFSIVAFAQNAISKREVRRCEGSVLYKLIHIDGPLGGIKKCVPNPKILDHLKP